MSDSILEGTKKALGLEADYTPFDLDITMHINSVFLTLQQLGVGPTEGFSISGSEEKWEAFIGNNKNLNAVKTYMYLRVRLLFDPPTTSFAIESMANQVKEMEWRLNGQMEVSWVPPPATF